MTFTHDELFEVRLAIEGRMSVLLERIASFSNGILPEDAARELTLQTREQFENARSALERITAIQTA